MYEKLFTANSCHSLPLYSQTTADIQSEKKLQTFHQKQLSDGWRCLLALVISHCCFIQRAIHSFLKKCFFFTATSGKVPNTAHRVPFYQHVIDVVSTCFFFYNGCLCPFTQYCNGGDLADYLQGKHCWVMTLCAHVCMRALAVMYSSDSCALVRKCKSFLHWIHDFTYCDLLSTKILKNGPHAQDCALPSGSHSLTSINLNTDCLKIRLLVQILSRTWVTWGDKGITFSDFSVVFPSYH